MLRDRISTRHLGKTLVLIATLLAIGGDSFAVRLERGDILLSGTDLNVGSVYRIKPDTLARKVVASDTVGSGEPLIFPKGIAVARDGAILVADTIMGAIIRIDPGTGHRVTVSGNVFGGGVVGGGEPLRTPLSIDVESSGDILATSHEYPLPSRVLRIDYDTGDRSIVTSDSVGLGPFPNLMRGLAIEEDGSIVVVGQFDTDQGLLRIDPATGDRTYFAPLTGIHSGIAIESTGDILVPQIGSGAPKALYRVDADSGSVTVLSQTGVGMGIALLLPLYAASQLDGQALVSDDFRAALIRIDVATGDRIVIAEQNDGRGPAPLYVQDVTVVTSLPAPLPSASRPLLIVVAALLATTAMLVLMNRSASTQQ